MLLFVFYTNWMIQSKFAAQTYGPFIFIRPSRKSDIGLLEHEKVHVKQFWKNPFFGLPYLFSKQARLRYEVEAYRKQLEFSPGREQIFASHLATKHNIGITQEEAVKLLVA